MDKKELIEEIIKKPELRKLPREDVEMAFCLCDKESYSDGKKVKCTREILHRVYGAFGSKKLLILKDREPEWILRKHLSTRERLPFYSKLYKKLLNGKEIILDLGCGVNGFSLGFIPHARYIGVEGIGQLVDLMNQYFKKEKLNAKSVHLSLFNLEKIKNLFKKEKGEKVVFLFKVLDSLEMLERNYSKKFLKEIAPLVDKVVVSFATRSMILKIRFKVKRSWIVDYIKENFKLLDDFELGSERYLVFKNEK